jgi:UDP-N-acetylglucosamine:LPS N-acetylglucosamine transferase
LSGPEPQRTILENSCLRELRHYKKSAILIRGLPGEKGTIAAFNGVTIYNHLPSQELNKAVNASRIIVSRSGYSTIMDILPLEKSCVFVPTPGQSEQIYLAEYLSQKKYGKCYYQNNFSLLQALEELSKEQSLQVFKTLTHNNFKRVVFEFIFSDGLT